MNIQQRDKEAQDKLIDTYNMYFTHVTPAIFLNRLFRGYRDSRRPYWEAQIQNDDFISNLDSEKPVNDFSITFQVPKKTLEERVQEYIDIERIILRSQRNTTMAIPEDKTPLPTSLPMPNRQYGYYWVKQYGGWFISEWSPNDEEWFHAGTNGYGVKDGEFAEINESRILWPDEQNADDGFDKIGDLARGYINWDFGEFDKFGFIEEVKDEFNITPKCPK